MSSEGFAATKLLDSKDPSTETMDSNPNARASNSNDEARGSSEEMVHSAPEMYRSQFWLNHVQIENACRIAVDTVVSTAALRPHAEGLEEYITATFGISEQKKKKLWQSRQGVTRRLMLSCKVISALRMAPKNAVGQSNLYLLLGVVPNKNIGDRVTKRGLLREGQEEGTVGNIFRSRTQLSTLEPLWNELFDIPLQDREESTLVIEMWNSREAIACISQVNDVKGFARYQGCYAKLDTNDVLIGWTYCNAKTLCLQGDEMSLGLSGTTPGRKCGSIKIHLSVSGKSEQSTKVLINAHHMTLYKALVMKESEQALKSRQEVFPSCLSSNGERLLHLHACYNGLSKLQEYSMRLEVLLSYSESCPFLPSVFIPLLDLLIAEYHLFGNEKKTALDPNNEWQSEWVTEIYTLFQTLLDESQKTLSDHFCVIDFSNVSGVKILEDHILLLKKLYTLDDFVNRLPSNDKSIQNVTIAFIKESFERWFYSFVEDQSDDVLLGDTVQQCGTLCGVVRSKIGPVIKKHIQVDYFSTFISAMDGLVSKHTRQLCSRNVSQDEQLASCLMDIYISLKCINNEYILKFTDPRLCEQLQITKYQSWFKEAVPVWLKNIWNDCKTAIARSVEIDEFSSSITGVKFSSSSLDAITFLYKMKSFWDILHWPPSEDAARFCIAITQYMTTEAIGYVDKLCSIWPQYNRCTNATQFSVTQHLCIIISNIQHIQEELKPIPPSNSSEKKLYTFEIDPCTEQSTNDLWQQTKGSIQNQFQEASHSCHQKLLTLCEQIGLLFEATIITFIKDLGKPKAEENLLVYMNTNLAFLRTNLPDPAFIMVLQTIWTSVIRAFKSKDFGSDSNEDHLKRKDLLLSIHGVFQGEGNGGLVDNQQDIEEYKVLLNELHCMSRPTHHLVQDLCADLARQQAETSSSCGLGMVGINVGYIKDQSILEVTLVGNSIPCNGSLHISLDILPRVNTHISPKRFSIMLNKQEGNSQNFSDEFKVTLSEDTIRTEGGILVVGLYSQKKDGLIGICVVPCHEIPTITEAAPLLSASGQSRRRLDCFVFRIKESNAMKELERRQKSDHEASVFLLDFHKQYMHVQNNSHPVSRMCTTM